MVVKHSSVISTFKTVGSARVTARQNAKTAISMRLVLAIDKEEMSVKNMMEAVGLKNRPNFMDYSLTPAIREGFVCMKYPANPHHPRQRYLLTIKGLMLLDGNNS